MSAEHVIDAPLGAEDAAKREDVGVVFVDVRQLIPQTMLHTNEITSIKVVVGRKGSGKTHILRYIEETARRTRDVVFSALGDNTLPTRLESQFATAVDRPHARSRWSKLWRVVISLSIITKFTAPNASHDARKAAARFLSDRGYLPERIRATEWPVIRSKLMDYFEEYLLKDSTFRFARIRQERDPGSLMPLVLEGINSLASLDEFIDYVDMPGLELDVSSLAKQYKPIHVIIDGVDEVSWRQPRMWLDFQVGLFDAVFYYNEAQRNSDQISLTVAIRNFVYLAASESMHIDRVKHLLSLNWSPNSALNFLNRRLNQISGQQFADANKLANERPLAAWLGYEKVTAIRRDKEEDVEQYFLRHTRLSPRNMIRLFNLLCQEKNHKIFHGQNFQQSHFQTVVEAIAGEVSDLMLKTAAEEIIAFIGEISIATSHQRAEGVVTWVASVLENSIRDVACEVMTWEAYRKFLRTLLLAVLPDNSDGLGAHFEKNLQLIETILWRSHVIAFWNGRKFQPGWVFSWSPHVDQRPKPGGLVGFHSSLIRKCDLEVHDHGPVF